MTSSTGPLRVIVYARVSTAHQVETGLGLEAQIARCRAWAEYRGHQVAEVITENGVSGTLAPDARPGLGKALRALKRGRADCLIVAKLDRLGRDTADILGLAALAEREGWRSPCWITTWTPRRPPDALC